MIEGGCGVVANETSMDEDFDSQYELNFFVSCVPRIGSESVLITTPLSALELSNCFALP